MTLSKHRAGAVALAATVSLLAAACGGGSGTPAASGSKTEPAATGLPTNTGSAAPVSEGKKGGTLTLLNDVDFQHLDPQRNYVSNELNFAGRYLTRTLVTYDSKPGPDGSKIVPDLATDIGKPSNANKTWTFTLKDGIKFDDGSPVTCADFKYGISRIFSSEITDGPPYPRTLLAMQQNAKGDFLYKGPYVPGPNGGLDTAVQCPTPKTVVFNLASGVGDFNYALSLPAFGPVPKAKDKGAQYDRSVVSTGPYKIQSYTPKKQMTLVRNDQWDASTDTVRKAYPDKVVVLMGFDPSVIDSRLIADGPADQAALQGSTFVQPEALPQALSNPAVKKRVVSGFDGSTWYMSINTKKVTNIKVRQAIQAAVNRSTVLRAFGGSNTGVFATSNIIPTLTSHKNFEIIPGVPPTGDAAKAKSLLKEAGVPTPYPLKFDVVNKPTSVKAASAIKEALDAVGFKVTLNPLGPDGYYTLIGHTKQSNELIWAGWGPDWPNGSSVIPPLYQEVLPDGNQNYSQLVDPEVTAGIKAANAENDLAKQAKLWGDLDELIVVKKAAVVPIYWRKANQLHGSKVQGAFLHAFFGDIDLATVSVAG